MMPRIYTIIAAIVPIVAVLYVLRSFDVAARLQLSWPLALHPHSSEDAAQLHFKPDSPANDDIAGEVTPTESSQQDTQVQGQFTRRIVAVGDLHGDLGNAYDVLKMAGVVNEDGSWSGNVDFFVQTGDIVDRYATRP